jgi:hypothetical protein
MTMTDTFFAGRIVAAVFAFMLSATIMVGAVGPAVNVQPAAIGAQGPLA